MSNASGDDMQRTKSSQKYANAVQRVRSRGPAPPVSQPTDEELLFLVVSGNGNAFDQFVQRYERRLIAYLSQRISPRPNIETIEDLAQETFLRAFRATKGGHMCEGLASVATWLFAIANNIVRDHFRSEQRKPMTNKITSLILIAFMRWDPSR